MSLADRIFVDMCDDIIKNGTSTEGEKVRPKWEDGSSAYTVKKFGVVNRYDLREEFPAITLRRTAVKSATDEMLWIWQRKSNDIHTLKSSVWDEWADENGSIGTAYGYQMGIRHFYADINEEGLIKAFGDRWEEHALAAEEPDHGDVTLTHRGRAGYMMDQVDRVIYDLKNNPFSRRIITNLYVHKDLHAMHLYPCAYSMTFNVTAGDHDKLLLNAVLNQRSQDVLAANNWNVCQYAVLLHMLARTCDMEAGILLHVIADAHIYDRHIPLVKELITREQYPAPKFILNPDKHDFYDFTADDIRLEDYETGPQIKNIPIAV
ncbi:MAG: thymidylate synthase [Lachnospiraceae bacterium]|nr:thymidylate synthase [Lachnospiraceae bacterium]